VTGDFGRRLCGQPPLCPTEWRAIFNPGTQPSTEREVYPSMEALCERLRAVYADFSNAALTADPALLSKDNPYVPSRAGFPTAGDFVVYLLTGHLAYHFGQLAAWRSAAGLGRVKR
jgi:hypothetical protein